MTILKNTAGNIIAVGDKIISNIPNGQDGFYYTRYKNDGYKKLFFSSKYLKDAVIDSSDNITSLKSSIENVEYKDYSLDKSTYCLLKADSTGKPKWTKNGIKFDVAAVIDRMVNYSETSIWAYYATCNEFTFMYWHCPLSSTQNLWHSFLDIVKHSDASTVFSGGFFYNWNAYANKYALYSNGTFYPSNKTDAVNTYNHVALIFKGGTIYILINGILVNSLSKTQYNGLVRVITYIGGYGSSGGGDCLMDDPFFSIKAEVDPTGKSVGTKVFEPPRRGGFNGTFKVY